LSTESRNPPNGTRRGRLSTAWSLRRAPPGLSADPRERPRLRDESSSNFDKYRRKSDYRGGAVRVRFALSRGGGFFRKTRARTKEATTRASTGSRSGGLARAGVEPPG